jgi:hypothetical protein
MRREYAANPVAVNPDIYLSILCRYRYLTPSQIVSEYLMPNTASKSSIAEQLRNKVVVHRYRRRERGWDIINAIPGSEKVSLV